MLPRLESLNIKQNISKNCLTDTMSLEIFNFFIVLISLLYATISDIKLREVPNWLTLGLLAYGILVNSVFFILSSNFLNLTYFLIFVAVVFGICYLFWRLGIFAGGDAKLFAGISAVIPFQTFFIFGIVDSKIPFVVSLFVLSILAMLPVGAISIFSAFRNQSVSGLLKDYFKNKFSGSVLNIIYLVALYFLFSFFTWPFYIFLIVAILIGLIPSKIRYSVSISLFIVSLAVSWQTTLFSILSTIVILILFWIVFRLFVFAKSGALNYKKALSLLKEGDILAYPLVSNEEKLTELKYSFFSELKKALKNRDIVLLKSILKTRKDLYNKIIINNNLACGLTKEEIYTIQKGFSEEAIELKQSVPLVPAIFLAFIVMFVFGDLLWLLLV